MFDICIPTYNSLEYLELCIHSIKVNSMLKHRMLVHDNGSTDGTLEWLKKNKIDYSYSDTNQGFCAVNHCIRRTKSAQVMIMNADMVALPQWDLPFVPAIKKMRRNEIDKYTISARLVEPHGNNPEYIIQNFGDTPATLDQNSLFRTRFQPVINTNQYSHPILFPAKLLKLVGGFDEHYWPGWCSDHDIAKRCYAAGCRDFVMLGNSHVYHFSSATFNKLAPEDKARHGQDIFERQWNQTVDEFRASINIKQPYEKSK